MHLREIPNDNITQHRASLNTRTPGNKTLSASCVNDQSSCILLRKTHTVGLAEGKMKQFVKRGIQKTSSPCGLRTTSRRDTARVPMNTSSVTRRLGTLQSIWPGSFCGLPSVPIQYQAHSFYIEFQRLVVQNFM